MLFDYQGDTFNVQGDENEKKLDSILIEIFLLKNPKMHNISVVEKCTCRNQKRSALMVTKENARKQQQVNVFIVHRKRCYPHNYTQCFFLYLSLFCTNKLTFTHTQLQNQYLYLSHSISLSMCVCVCV